MHLRRRTLWYRTFWSSALRRILSAVAVVYLLFFYLFNPGLRLILHYGQILSDNQNSSSDISSLMKNKTAGVKNQFRQKTTFHRARENTKHIMKRIRDIKDKNRNGLRRKGIPKWFHHDDKEYAQEVGNNIDGTLFKSDDPDIPASSIEEIDDLVEPNESTLRTLENISHHNSKSLCPRDVDQIATTLVLQATFDRLPLIRQTCRRWKSPIKLVVYLTLDEAENMWDETIKEYNTFCNNLSLIPHISKAKDERRHAYPINLMRNIGLDHVTTSHVLVLDIDLIPSTNLDYELATAIELAIEARMDDDGDRGIDPKDAIIVPAFERKSPIACETLLDCQHLSKEDASFIPNTMIELRSCLSDKECIVFQSDMNMAGHADTRSISWLNKEDTSILTNIECFHSIRYEPYVVVPWCPFMKNAEQMLGNTGPRSPYYDERFHGYGKNKIQQIAHLRERGYAFMVMPPMGFIIHHPHPESITKEVWNDRVSNLLHRQMDELYLRYLQDLQHEYQYERIMTPICKKIY